MGTEKSEKTKPAKSEANLLQETSNYLDKLMTKSSIDRTELTKVKNNIFMLKKKKQISQVFLTKISTIANNAENTNSVEVLRDFYKEFKALKV